MRYISHHHCNTREYPGKAQRQEHLWYHKNGKIKKINIAGHYFHDRHKNNGQEQGNETRDHGRYEYRNRKEIVWEHHFCDHAFILYQYIGGSADGFGEYLERD
jgi:hypothetical protein